VPLQFQSGVALLVMHAVWLHFKGTWSHCQISAMLCFGITTVDTCNTTVYFCGIVVEYSDACTAIQSHILHIVVFIDAAMCKMIFSIDSAVYHGSFLMTTMLYNYTFRHFQCIFNIDTSPLFASVLAVKE
jgi:hypothetical protein